MRKVQRSEILDYETYGEQRDEIRAAAMAAKDARRVQLGDHLTFLFENHDTIRYQVLEMVRVEQLVKEAAIQHELDTYNELLGDHGQLGCTLLIQYDDPNERDRQLRALSGLERHLYLRLTDGKKAPAIYDHRQISEEKLSSVQFLKFTCPAAPVAIGCDHPDMRLERELSPAQRAILTADLGD